MNEMEMINRWITAVNYDSNAHVFKMDDFSKVMAEKSPLEIAEIAAHGYVDRNANFFMYDPNKPLIYCYKDLAYYPYKIGMPLFYGEEDITIDGKTMGLDDWEELADDSKSAPAGFIETARQILEDSGMNLNQKQDAWTDQDILDFLKMRTFRIHPCPLFDLNLFKKCIGPEWNVLETAEESALIFHTKEKKYGIFIINENEGGTHYDDIYYSYDLDSAYEEWKTKWRDFRWQRSLPKGKDDIRRCTIQRNP